MLFNSFHFIIFLPVVLFLFFTFKNGFQLIILLAASFYFYMVWEPFYIVLILSSTIIDYYASRKIYYETNIQTKKLFLVLSIVSNLSLLFAFKYYNLFVSTFSPLIGISNGVMSSMTLDLLLPVGISFYTFQTMSYTIDVYKGITKPENNFLRFSLFVSFFPQLVAGPIERSSNLLPQFTFPKYFKSKNLEYGILRIAWGFFKKLVIADRVAIYVNAVYNNQAEHSGQSLFFATILFSIQIYCDFSGYSDIAIGSAKIMGFDLMENFKRPYFAISIKNFWERWHISLSTWFRDYLYIPLGGNRVSLYKWYLNLFVVFLISGFWHGANWTFMIWGGLHGIYLILSLLLSRFKLKISNLIAGIFNKYVQVILKILITYALVCFSWIFFRANTVQEAFLIIEKIFSFSGPLYLGKIYYLLYAFFGIMLLLLHESIIELSYITKVASTIKNFFNSYLFVALLIIIVLLIGVFDGGQFIYFQF